MQSAPIGFYTILQQYAAPIQLVGVLEKLSVPSMFLTQMLHPSQQPDLTLLAVLDTGRHQADCIAEACMA